LFVNFPTAADHIFLCIIEPVLFQSPAAQTLDKMLQTKLVTRDVARRRRAVLLTAEAMVLQDADETRDRARALAVEAADLEPGFAPSVALAARLLADGSQVRKAGRIIERAWASAPHPDMADVYLTLDPAERPFDRLRRVRGLVARKPGVGESQMVLARAALGARDFETAREALEPLLADEPSQRICELMGELEAAAPAVTSAPDAARSWLARALHAPADPCWVGEGYQGDVWVAVVPSTGAFDALNWQVPPGRQGTRAALVPPEAMVNEAEVPDQTALEPPAEMAPEEEAVESTEDETPVRATLPERVVVAPDDPGTDEHDLEPGIVDGR